MKRLSLLLTASVLIAAPVWAEEKTKPATPEKPAGK